MLPKGNYLVGDISVPLRKNFAEAHFGKVPPLIHLMLDANEVFHFGTKYEISQLEIFGIVVVKAARGVAHSYPIS